MCGTDFDFKKFMSHDLFTRIPIAVVVEIQEAECFVPPPQKKKSLYSEVIYGDMS